MARGFTKQPMLLTKKDEERGDYIKDVFALDDAISKYKHDKRAVHILEILQGSAELALEKFER